MKNPRVATLIYEVSSPPGIHFDQAPPLTADRGDLSIEVANGQVRIGFERPQFASPDDARAAAIEFITAWEISAGLDFGPLIFKLRYKDAEIIDLSSGHVRLASDLLARICIGGPGIDASISAYPAPPDHLEVSETLKRMFSRYEGYTEGRIPLSTAAYFCLTAIKEEATRSQRRADALFCIDARVLRKLGELTAIKGGTEARKAHGAVAEWSKQERRWVEQAMIALIRRVAERDAQPGGSFQRINISDLPPL